MKTPYVLVVDDDPGVRNLVADALTVLGCPHRKARNGQEALDLIVQQRPAAIVLDLVMPQMNGFSLLASLQWQQRSRDIPVIVFSGMIDEVQPVDRLPGVVAVLVKTDFSMDRFRRLLHQAGVNTIL